MVGLSPLPVGALVALGAVLVIEVVLDVIALVDLYRRPIERVALGNKWVWVAIIVLINLIGFILYFIVGRKPAPVADQPTPAPTGPKKDIGDALYGARDDSTTP